MLFRPEYVKELGGNELRLLLIMKVMANGSDTLEASIEIITSWMAGCCTRTVLRTINQLIAKEYLSKHTTKGPHPSVYTFLK